MGVEHIWQNLDVFWSLPESGNRTLYLFKKLNWWYPLESFVNIEVLISSSECIRSFSNIDIWADTTI